MQFLFNSPGKDVPVKGIDWIVLGANAMGIAIVVAATLHANAPSAQIAEASAPTLTVASLD